MIKSEEAWARLQSAGHAQQGIIVRLLGLWSCVGKGEIRHDERLAIDMKFSPAVAFLIGFSQRSFVWEMTGGSLRRLTPSGADVNFKLRCAAPVLSLCSRTESLHLAGLPVSWFSVNPTRPSSANTRPSQQADGWQADEVVGACGFHRRLFPSQQRVSVA